MLMWSDCDKISFITMSNSEVFVVKDKTQDTQFNHSKDTPKLESMQNSHISTSSSSLGEVQQEVKERKLEETENIPTLGGLNATEDEEENGFKTPTSSDHKIPLITQCPGAPRKPKFSFSSRKRQASSSSSSSSSSSPTSNARRALQNDLSQEVESLFPKPIIDDLHSNKRARRESDKE